MEKFLASVDSINEWMGKIFGWVFILLVVIVTYEVVVRYVFNNPTLWVSDISVQLLAAIAVTGGGYAFLHKNHVSIDILVNKLQARKRVICEVITGILVIGGISLLLWRVSLGAWHSVITKENFSSAFAPPIYPLKVLMVIGIGAMLLQAIADWLRSLLILIKRYGNEH